MSDARLVELRPAAAEGTSRLEAHSYWAFSADPAQAFPALEGEIKADVAIVGGGFTGLSAAHHLAKAGLAPVVLDSQSMGWGASGRNGGFVSGRFRVSFPAMARTHGSEVARRMYRIGVEAVECVGQIVDELGLASCNFRPYGGVTGAYDLRSTQALEATANWLRAEVGDASSKMLSREAIADETGSARFLGGVLSSQIHGVHPLNLARGVIRSLAERSIPLYERSPVLRYRRDGGDVIAETPNGAVRARQLIIATNAYTGTTGLSANLARRIVPFRSALIATAPLPEALRNVILPSRRLLADSKRVLRYCRIVDDRLLFGGRGAFDGQDASLAYGRLLRNMTTMYPQLDGVPIDFRWLGFVAMTLDYLPHIGNLDDRVLFAMGYNGTGVALSNLMGRYLALLARNETVDVGLLSFSRFPTMPLHALRAPVVRVAAGWQQLLDSIGR